MPSKLKRFAVPSFPPQDEMGFAVPATPAHSLQLLNGYMRTDILRSLHTHLHRLKDEEGAGSPLEYFVVGLSLVIEEYEEINLFEIVGRNPFHHDPRYDFEAEKDYAHDIKLMKHHRKCHEKTIKLLDDD